VRGRHKQVMCALHPLTGAAVESANRWRGSNSFMKNVVKETDLYGVLSFKLDGIVFGGNQIMKLFNCD
jgi:hypothetical protein